MRRQAKFRRAVVVAAVSGVLLATACSSSTSGAGVTAARKDIATIPATTTTTDPYAVPPVIDAAYVNRVLAGLDAAVGDVVRLIVTTKKPTTEFLDRLTSLYNDEALSLQLQLFSHDATKNYDDYRPEPGNEITTITELVTATPECIFAHVNHNFDPMVKNPNPELSNQWVGVVRLDPTRDPHHYNQTGWSYVYDGFEEDRSIPKNPCDAT